MKRTLLLFIGLGLSICFNRVNAQCISPDVPFLAATADTICPGSPVTLIVASGNLDSATVWVLYEDGCGVTFDDANAAGVFTVSPSVTTTYFVRGEGGCVVPDVCSSITIVVNPIDTASFSYSSSSYCQNASNPLATITGTIGGTFQGNIEGITVDSNTGTIDLTNSVGGNYIVTYTTTGICPASSNVNVTVLPVYNIFTDVNLCGGDSVFFDGQYYNATNVYTHTYPSINGCDSSLILNLTVYNSPNTSQNPTLCFGDSIIVGSHTYNSSGLYTDTLHTVHGCDSIVTTNLTVNPLNTTTQTLTICAEDSVIVGPVVFKTTGNYTTILVASNACDSTVYTNLTVMPAITGNQSPVICAGDSITVGTHTYNSTGIYTDVFPSFTGCDSTFTTNLTVMLPITRNQSPTICAGDSITVGTHTYYSNGSYTDVLPSFAGCDSTVNTNLTVLLPITGSQSLTICAGDSITIGLHTYNSNGSYTDVLPSFAGCDSTLTTNLIVRLPISGSQSPTICAEDSLIVGTHIYHSTGNFTDTLSSFTGCDSIVSTQLTVNPTITGSQSFTICAGDSIAVGTHNYSSTGNYTDIFPSFTGCDSTVTTNLTVRLLITGSQFPTICAGDSIIVGTHTYNSTGIYTDIFPSFTGCDSLFTTNLTVMLPITGSQFPTICAGDSITVGAHTYNSTGTYTDVFPSFAGCDSTFTTNLTVRLPITGSQSPTICAGDSIIVGIHTYNSTGNYTDILPSFAGCDSTVMTNLTVRLPITTSQSPTICAEDSLVVGTHVYHSSGNYIDVLPSFAGCDSTVTSNLTVLPAIIGSQTLTICANTSVTVGSHTYNATGDYIDIFGAFNGCDSTYFTHLTVSPPINASQNITICAGDSLTVGASVYNSTGSYSDLFYAHNGCDSTLTTNLTVLTPITGSQSLTICNGSSITVGTHTYNSTGTYTDILSSFTSCDSTVTTHLTVHPPITGSQSLTICNGTSITVGTNTYNSTGTYTDVLTSFTLCDSTVTTHLTVRSAITGSQSPTICAGNNITVGTHTYNSTGTYTDTLTSFTTCDSTVTTHLTVRLAITGSQSPTICAGDSITVGTHTYHTNGTYTDVLTSFTTCDSTVTTHLTVMSAITGSQSSTICGGDTLFVGSNIHTTTGTYIDVIPSHAGCDSTVTSHLTVRPVNSRNQYYHLCQGGAVLVGSSIYNSTGTYSDIYPAHNGCDSIVFTHLNIEALPIVNLTAFDSVVCSNSQTFTLTNGSPAGGYYSGPGVIDSSMYDPATAGLGTRIITYTFASNDSLHCVNHDTASLTEVSCQTGIQEYEFGNNINIYPNPTTGMFTIAISNAAFSELTITIYDIQGRVLYTYLDKNTASDYTKQIGLETFAKGIYYIKLNTDKDSKIQKLVIQ